MKKSLSLEREVLSLFLDDRISDDPSLESILLAETIVKQETNERN
jgi:hypothetical protein